MTAIAQAFTAALLDFVWQGLLVAVLLWIALFLLRRGSANARYAVSCAALTVLAALPIVTTLLLYRVPVTSGPAAAASAAVSHSAGVSASGPAWAAMLERWALPIWSFGVLFFSLRLVWASRQVARLRRQAKPPEESVLSTLARLKARLGLARHVPVLLSSTTDGPSVIGWIRPVVLLPAATVMGLTPLQLEAVLAHELAHIRRYDYLVNMVQVFVETLLFYHPAVWWASSRMRYERELCCDDLAVSACRDALCYARALTKLERLRITAPRLALGSTGGPLLHRIQRLMGTVHSEYTPSKMPAFLAILLGVVSLGLNLPLAGESSDVKVDTGSATLIHRAPVEYPAAAIDKHIKGKVVMEVTIDSTGEVSDARVLSGPAELRRSALQSVLRWHFTREAAGTTRQVSITFPELPEGSQLKLSKERAELAAQQLEGTSADLAKVRAEQKEQLAAAMDMQRQAGGLASGSQIEARMKQVRILSDQSKFSADAEGAAKSNAEMAELRQKLSEIKQSVAGRVVKSITTEGLADPVRDDLLSRLPVHVGDTLSEESMKKFDEAVSQFDEHLRTMVFTGEDGQAEMHISAPNSGEPQRKFR